MPALVNLDITCNYITTLKSLNRCNWPNLNGLAISSNFIA